VAGHRITSNDDPYLHISHMIVEAMSKTGTPGGSPVDFFPIRERVNLFVGDDHQTIAHSPTLPFLVPRNKPHGCCEGLQTRR
jgi:hypothetical protein